MSIYNKINAGFALGADEPITSGVEDVIYIFNQDDVIKMFDKNTDIYCVLFWGANDLIYINDITFQVDITAAISALQNAGAKVIVVPILSRKDAFAASVSYINITRRNAVNAWYNSSFTGDKLFDLTPYPQIFSDSAPDNATYFTSPDVVGFSKVHLTDAGANLLAQAVADAIRALTLTLSKPITHIDYASNFIDAAGITNTDQIAAINGLVNDLIESGLWYRFYAIWPFVGGTATSHKINLLDCRDVDAAYRLTFYGSPIHNSSGVTWDSGAYADTNFAQPAYDTLLNNLSMHYYSRAVTSGGIDMGFGGTYYTQLGIKFAGSNASYANINDNSGSGSSESYSDIGLFSVSRANQFNNKSLYRNGVKVRDYAHGINIAGPFNIWIGGRAYFIQVLHQF